MNIDLAVDVTGTIARCGQCGGELAYDPAYGEPQLTHHDDGSHTMSWKAIISRPRLQVVDDGR